MTTDFQCCQATTVLSDVLLMLNNSTHDVVVVVNHKNLPIGVISSQDIEEIYSCSGCEYSEIVASDVIKNKQIYNCWEGDDIQIAVSMINDRGVSYLPVVNNEFCLVGVMSACNALSYFKDSTLSNSEIVAY